MTEIENKLYNIFCGMKEMIEGDFGNRFKVYHERLTFAVRLFTISTEYVLDIDFEDGFIKIIFRKDYDIVVQHVYLLEHEFEEIDIKLGRYIKHLINLHSLDMERRC